jgi:hypothetical protein
MTLSPAVSPIRCPSLARRALTVQTLGDEIARRRPTYGQTLDVFWAGLDDPAPVLPPLAPDSRAVTGAVQFTLDTAYFILPDGTDSLRTSTLTVSCGPDQQRTLHPETSLLLEQATLAWMNREVTTLSVLLGVAHPNYGWTTAPTDPDHCTLQRTAHVSTFKPTWTETHVSMIIRDLDGPDARPSIRWPIPWKDLPALHATLHGINRAYLQNAVPELLAWPHRDRT